MQIVSRAGAKFVEASELLALVGESFPTTSTILELGAAPSGITAQIAKLGFSLIAIDRAVLSPDVLKLKNVKFIKTDAKELQFNHRVDAIACHLNGPCEISLETVCHVARF